MIQNTVNLEAAVFVRMDVEAGTIETGVLNRPDGGAMFVFRSEAERYRAESGDYTATEGWKAGHPSPEDMRGLLEIHEVSRAAFPQELEGGGRWVHFYEAHYFLDMLEAAPMSLDALQN